MPLLLLNPPTGKLPKACMLARVTPLHCYVPRCPAYPSSLCRWSSTPCAAVSFNVLSNVSNVKLTTIKSRASQRRINSNAYGLLGSAEKWSYGVTLPHATFWDTWLVHLVFNQGM